MDSMGHRRTSGNHAGSRMKNGENGRADSVKTVSGILLIVFSVLVSFIHIYGLIANRMLTVLWPAEFRELAVPAVSACISFSAGLFSYRGRYLSFRVTEAVFLPLSCAAALVPLLAFSGEPVYFIPLAALSAVLMANLVLKGKKDVP